MKESILETKTIEDILQMPKSGKKVFDECEFVRNLFPRSSIWDYAIRGLYGGLYFIIQLGWIDYPDAKEIAEDEMRVLEYIKTYEPRAYRLLFKRNRRKNHTRRWNRWQVKRKS
jgi:hypothetical protein